MLKKLLFLSPLLAALLLCASCDKAESERSSYRAFMRFSPVTGAPQLLAALTSPGMFCMVQNMPGRVRAASNCGAPVTGEKRMKAR